MTTSELWLEPMIFSLPIPIETCMQNLGLLSAVSQIQGFLPLSHLTNIMSPPYYSTQPVYNSPFPYYSTQSVYNSPFPYYSTQSVYNSPFPYYSTQSVYNSPFPYYSTQSVYNSPLHDVLDKLVEDFKVYLKNQKEISDQFNKFSDINFKEVDHRTATQSQVSCGVKGYLTVCECCVLSLCRPCQWFLHRYKKTLLLHLI